MNRAVALVGGAMLLTLLVGGLLRDTPGYMLRNADGTLSGDITHYVYWTRLVTLGGVQSAYDGTWPETYAVYPPLTLYAYQAVGTVYRQVQDPLFDPARAQDSLFLRAGIKLVALVWHVLTGAAIFLIGLRLRRGEALAAVAAALYLVDPATLYDVAHWAQPDGAHSLLSVLAVGGLSLGSLDVAWAAFALAALAKPQAWALGPLLAAATLRAQGLPRLARGLAIGAGTGVVVILPFVVTGHVIQLLSLPGTVSSVMPVVSADAHNAWWLIATARGQNPLYVLDSARFIGPLTYRLVALALVGATLALSSWLYCTRRASLAESAALSVLGWFTFTTQAHENHLFFALPLLSLAWPDRRWLLVPFGLISLTLLLNMILHDQLVLQDLGLGLDDPVVVDFRLANAVLNVVCCLSWAISASLRRPNMSFASATVKGYWPRPLRAKAPT